MYTINKQFSFYRNLKVLLFISFSFFPKLYAQMNTKDLGSWGMLFSQTRLHNKWSLHSELQFRSYEISPNTEQLLLRGGINFHYNPNLILTAGYGHITNYSAFENTSKIVTAEENRIWEQMILKNNIKRILIEHRYRFEQRWVHSNYKTNYRNRIRYLLRATIPINNKEIIKKTVFLTFYDEIFIHLSNAPFDRNRLYAALGYQVNSALNIQAGYLLQTVGTLSKQYIQLGITFNPDLRKPAKAG
jgi:hypothetical protein